MQAKINPKCHSGKGIAYVSTGHFLPCCWCDNLHPKVRNYFKTFGFFDDELKIENNENIEDILMSSTWIDYHKVLLQQPHKASFICKQNCGVGFDLKKEKR